MVVINLPAKALKEKLSIKGDFQSTLSETLFKIGMELEQCTQEETSIDIAGAGNRIDAVSLEGIVRIINAYNGKPTFSFPRVKSGRNIINVDKSVANVRPFMGNFIVRNVDIDDDLLTRVINYQEKIAATFGRDRKVLGMGLFRLPELKFPLEYTALRANEIKFAPLGFKQEMTGAEILKKHDKGKVYAHLFAGKDKLPILRDASRRILTMPGITNSNDLGKVELGKQDLFIEATGTNLQMIIQLLTANALDFADMGAVIETCTVNYSGKKIEFPQFGFDKYSVPMQQINLLLGLELKPSEACKLLLKMMLPASSSASVLNVNVPRFRSDVLHNVDIIEDVARAYGFDNFKPISPQAYTFGKKHDKTTLFNAVIDSFTGLGFQQVIGMILTSKIDSTTRVKISDNSAFVELHSSRALGLNAVRQSLFPSLLSIIASNKQYTYPQKIFEVGECLQVDASEETGASTHWKAAAIIASASTSFTEAKATIESLARSLDDYKLKVSPVEDKRFIQGRSASTEGKSFKGVFGEVDIEILREFNIEMPCAFLEIELKR